MTADRRAALMSLPGVRVLTRVPVPPGAVGITPTTAADRFTVAAPDLVTANRAMTVLATRASASGWPADVRFAAPPRPVIGAPDALAAAVRQAIPDATLVAVPEDGAPLPEGVDAVLTKARPCGDPRGAAVHTAEFSVLARPYDDAVALDMAAALTGCRVDDVWPLTVADPQELVVFGAHLLGGPLTHQLTDLGARWSGEVTTTPRYRMTVLPSTPAKPAVSRVPEGAAGAALYGQRWLMSAAALGRFLAALPPPMQLGKVEFADGSWRTGFSCGAAAADGADISAYGSWPAAIAAGAVPG
ncbi:hypothetical protein ASG82_00285 [Mycobacterium sp. Soil538]|nr:hypothetical protein ASG82_00285 [Mycobacterium sp. Soil538]